MSPASAPPSQRARVLVVDDDEGMRESLRDLLVELGYTCMMAADAKEALELHRKWHFDVVLSDWLMPGVDGLDLCRALRSQNAENYVYFVLVTGRSERSDLIHGLKAGADEYITKPIDVEELEARLRAACRVVANNRRWAESNVSLRKDSERALHIAKVDPLTGVNNRFSLIVDLASSMAQARRYGHRYCVGICDVDFFKGYNDHFGHVAGDEVLKRVADAMRNSLREGDTIYRYGGEEFLILLPEQTLEAGSFAMERLRASVEGLAIAHGAGTASSVVTVSAGVAEFDADHDTTPEAWLRRADAALYQAKASGRNRVSLDHALRAGA